MKKRNLFLLFFIAGFLAVSCINETANAMEWWEFFIDGEQIKKDYGISIPNARTETVQVYSGVNAYKVNNLWGFEGTIKLAPAYTEYSATGGSVDSIIVRDTSGYYGLVDSRGVVISPMYSYMRKTSLVTGAGIAERIDNPKFDLYIVGQNGREGIVNGDGEVVVPIQYQSVSVIVDCVLIKKNNREGVYSVEYRRELIPPIYEDIKYDTIGDFKTSETWYHVKSNGRWGLCDSLGEMVLNPEYDGVRALNSFFAGAKKYKWGVLDMDGKQIIPYKYDSVEVLNNYFKLKLDGKWGAADFNGKIVIPINKGPLEITREIKKLN